jgi:hypothetical protein
MYLTTLVYIYAKMNIQMNILHYTVHVQQHMHQLHG